MSYLYAALKCLLLPGAFVRGFWEQLMCKILKLPVENREYLSFSESCGHCEHSLAKTEGKAFLMATFPGFMNFNIGIWFFITALLNFRYMGITVYDSVGVFVLNVAFLYLGACFLCCLFPLREDIENFMFLAYKMPATSPLVIILRVLAFIPAIITKIGAVLEKYCITFLIYAAAVAAVFLL